MSAHTPGPWALLEQALDEDGEPAFVSIMAGRREVANTASGDFPTPIEIANARLIAAAPELLEALKSTSQLLMAAALVIEHAESRAHAIATAKGAQAAIAKAEAA